MNLEALLSLEMSWLLMSRDDDEGFMVALDWMPSGNLHKKIIDNSSLPIMTGLQWVEVT